MNFGGGVFGSAASKKSPEPTQTSAAANTPVVPAPSPPGAAITATTAPPVSDPTAHYLEDTAKSFDSARIEPTDSFIENDAGVHAVATPQVANPPSGELAKIKQQALQSLAPLVDKLEQTPDERFKTLLMMIQSSDNPQYLDEALAAANKITDDKARAEALLDVVNEANYFAQKSKLAS